MTAKALAAGDAAPWFHCRSRVNPRYTFDTAAGRYIVLHFFGTAARPQAAELLHDFQRIRPLFDDQHASFFGVSMDPADEQLQRVNDAVPGIRYFWDFDGVVSRLYGALAEDHAYQPLTYILDPRLRILAILPINTVAGHVDMVRDILRRLPRSAPPAPALAQAPVLVVPRILEAELCQQLIEVYEQHGGEESGFMQERNGLTVTVHGHRHKRRRDHHLQDLALRDAVLVRLRRRLVPEVLKAFQFSATYIERMLVACYDSAEGGHFRAHRDNTTKGTAHRRFAVSLFLNTGGYEGGLLRFPEFGNSLYSAPTGGAVVFSCSLLHEATPVTQGKRYMFLPFLYDDDAKRVRDANQQYLEDNGKALP
ncbi:2OG-Fe(II) oxygenase [Pseudomonas sp. UL073]|uniref:2OG-Fe(II) oxygenase n=1 Tax=Zestomonas insulae TaxID=2809017 RepID=A0ABS2IC88_9GAMM|nr:2OG-Fe(II) oxygenase [Pseudomonas insulae]MBM7059465.1 2OG-Fe(II) oxygenase [Pseudomonas insulae]